MESKQVLEGFGIVVAERGFVYIGDVVCDDRFCMITNAKNIRKWGTSKGLGELALKGVQKDTVLDNCGTVRVPFRAVISIIDSDEKLWAEK